MHKSKKKKNVDHSNSRYTLRSFISNIRDELYVKKMGINKTINVYRVVRGACISSGGVLLMACFLHTCLSNSDHCDTRDFDARLLLPITFLH